MSALIKGYLFITTVILNWVAANSRYLQRVGIAYFSSYKVVI